MLRKIVFIVFVCLFSVSLYSQDVFKSGIYAGLSTSQVSGDMLSGFDKAGLYAGAFVNFNFSPKSALQMEISYVQKGSSKVPRPSKGDYTSYKLNLQYVEVPILYKAKFNKLFTVDLGIATGYLLKNTDVEKDQSGIIPEREPFDRLDLSAVAGVNYALSKKIGLGVRFSQSCLPIRPHASGASYYLNFGQYNTVLAFLLQLQFN